MGEKTDAFVGAIKSVTGALPFVRKSHRRGNAVGERYGIDMVPSGWNSRKDRLYYRRVGGLFSRYFHASKHSHWARRWSMIKLAFNMQWEASKPGWNTVAETLGTRSY